MANIAIVKMLFGMTITGAQLVGELKAHGHNAKIIYFKRGEMIDLSNYNKDEICFGDVPMQSHVVQKGGDYLVETSAYKKIKPHEFHHLVTLLKELNVDAIGISSLSATMSLAETVSDGLREHFDVPILWGGTGPTVEPERAIKFADVLCVGEGEEVIVEIADRLDKGLPLDGIAGTWFRHSDGSVEKNPKRPVSDLEKIAMPDWSAESAALVTGPKLIRQANPREFNTDKSYQMMTQRGCPFSCSFCVESFYQNEFGKKDSLRRMSPEKAIAELRHAKDRLGYTSVTFMDDVFTVNPRWLEDFLELYKKEINLPFFCYTYPTTHNSKMLKLLVDAGCHAMTMGIQSGSYRILKEVYNRPTKVGRVVEAAREIIDSGIPASTFDLITKTEFDTEADLQETLDLLLTIPKEMGSSFYYNTMSYFANYPIQDKFQDSNLLAKTENISEDTYLFYYKLYDMTRNPALSNEEIIRISKDPKYRNDHHLLNQYLIDDGGIRPSFGTLIEQGLLRKKGMQSTNAATKT
ncbi:MAG: B12-binding domain-containing radical SAM protein [Pseudomonadales bacterium]|nr:B12-binding domain-containing radical SAM protein [Pseudomonadales bacterium]